MTRIVVHRGNRTDELCSVDGPLRAGRLRCAHPLRSAALVAIALACAEPTAPAVEALTTVQPAWVTGAASLALTAAGRWILPVPAYRFTSPARADTLALAEAQLWRDLAGDAITSGPLFDDHSGVVRLDDLHPCGAPYYVLPVTAPLPAAVDTNLARYLGPRYAVPLCDPRYGAQVVVDVGDARSSMVVDQGRFVPPWFNGNQVANYGVSPLAQSGLPTSPEVATAFVATTTDARIDQVPEAVANSPWGSLAFYPSQCMRWHLHLDRELVLRGASGTTYRTRDVYVSRLPACARGSLALQVALNDQPDDFSIPIRVFSADGHSTFTDSVLVQRVRPIRFEVASQ